MSTMEEMAAEYRLAAAKMRVQIQRMKAAGAPPRDIQACKEALYQLRDISQLLSGYYDAPRFSQNAAVGWHAGKKRSDK